ncbi:hypothetical protein M0R45_004699 [Rubus argutus]|uniref:Myb-like domain-containing protein n=1 Tax=Rubus argutus TaxID=59490 RepID=A0AAW1YKL6_RUBAR
MEGEGESQRPQKWTAKEEEALLAGVDKWRRLRSLGGTSTTVRTSGNYKPWRRSSVRSWGNYKPFRAAEALKEPQTISETNEAQRISKPADQDTESMLQLASQILERCSRR